MDTQNSDQNVPEAAPEEQLPAETVAGQLEAVTAERDALLAEKAELQDRLLRLHAEFDNFRRRADRERSDFLQFAAMDLAKEVLPILDDLQRALKTETTDRDYAKGVELIYQRFFDTLKRMGLEPIETEGKRFDPTIHQAVQREETDEAEDQSILAEYQRGYNFRGKLLRPAMVKVAVKP